MDSMSEIPGSSPFISSGNQRLDAQLKFTAVIDGMTQVYRRTRLLCGCRSENDAEHSWHIAMMGLLFQEYAVETPNVSHAIEMMLVHDLVELYAGDTFAYDVKGRMDKAQRERQSADRLFSILPEDQGAYIRGLWEEFEAVQTRDAKYANCLDRLQPVYYNTLTEGYTWRYCGTEKVARSQVMERMDILRTFMPKVYEWVALCVDRAVQNGWLVDDSHMTGSRC